MKDLAKRAGGASQLVAPTKRAEVEGMTEAAIIAYLIEDPRHLRRPIIDLGGKVLLGFTKKTKEALLDE
ncbi:MAG: arsenate reductase family protein [Actinomycetota bacterium]